ncbi:MAG: AbrB/MazE/SpoVT family DNA-binding domain-containing protein [Actinomycetota bacterium]|nr:AbrB/MazE/SpoVT family DNA-binding domain-containing protein [Actinomycetota bacterium]
MAYSTVTSKGQVTIPKVVRERMGIDEGTRLIFVDDGDRILVYKFESDLESLYGAVKHTGPPIDFAALKREAGKAVADRFLAESGNAPAEPMDSRGQQAAHKGKAAAGGKKPKGAAGKARASGTRSAASSARTGGKPKAM